VASEALSLKKLTHLDQTITLFVLSLILKLRTELGLLFVHGLELVFFSFCLLELHQVVVEISLKFGLVIGQVLKVALELSCLLLSNVDSTVVLQTVSDLS